jgi:hypothetical protein
MIRETGTPAERTDLMKTSLPVVVRQIRALAQPPRADDRSDRQLLRHFAASRDEAAERKR